MSKKKQNFVTRNFYCNCNNYLYYIICLESTEKQKKKKID